jgi:hypothetical protein
MTAIAQCREARAGVGRGRFSLWTGDVGLAVYLWDCITAEPHFPTVEYSDDRDSVASCCATVAPIGPAHNKSRPDGEDHLPELTSERLALFAPKHRGRGNGQPRPGERPARAQSRNKLYIISHIREPMGENIDLVSHLYS